MPDHVDAVTGYRWYADMQLSQARVVALLRRIGVPLAQIRDMLALDPAVAAGQIRDYWAGAEMEHAAQRELVSYLVDRLHGKKPAMYEVVLRDIPARRAGLRIRPTVALNQDTKPRSILPPALPVQLRRYLTRFERLLSGSAVSRVIRA